MKIDKYTLHEMRIRSIIQKVITQRIGGESGTAPFSGAHTEIPLVDVSRRGTNCAVDEHYLYAVTGK